MLGLSQIFNSPCLAGFNVPIYLCKKTLAKPQYLSSAISVCDTAPSFSLWITNQDKGTFTFLSDAWCFYSSPQPSPFFSSGNLSSWQQNHLGPSHRGDSVTKTGWLRWHCRVTVSLGLMSQALNEDGNFEVFIFSPSQSREQSPSQSRWRGKHGSLVLSYFLEEEFLVEWDSTKGLELQMQLSSENSAASCKWKLMLWAFHLFERGLFCSPKLFKKIFFKDLF